MSKVATKGRRVSGPPQRGARAARRGSPERPLVGPLSIIVMALAIAAVLGIYSPESLPLLGIGMLPTLGAAFAERNSKGIWIAVGWLDFAGLSNWLLDMWLADGRGADKAQLHSLTPILAAYLASMGGWILYAIMPTIAGAAIVSGLGRKRARLLAKQKKLVEQWDRGIIKRS